MPPGRFNLSVASSQQSNRLAHSQHRLGLAKQQSRSRLAPRSFRVSGLLWPPRPALDGWAHVSSILAVPPLGLRQRDFDDVPAAAHHSPPLAPGRRNFFSGGPLDLGGDGQPFSARCRLHCSLYDARLHRCCPPSRCTAPECPFGLEENRYRALQPRVSPQWPCRVSEINS